MIKSVKPEFFAAERMIFIYGCSEGNLAVRTERAKAFARGHRRTVVAGPPSVEFRDRETETETFERMADERMVRMLPGRLPTYGVRERDRADSSMEGRILSILGRRMNSFWLRD